LRPRARPLRAAPGRKDRGHRRGGGRGGIPVSPVLRRANGRAIRPANCTHRGGCACADADLRRSGPPSGDGAPRDRGELAAMKRECIAATLVLLLLGSSPALAWDPFRVRDEPPPPSREPDPAPFIAPPPGIYYVTDTYVADVVTSSGPLTTYSTATIHESTGSYARVLDIVGTGASSAFDGSAFNGRRTLGDGRSVAGTYYENYVLIDGGFVPISVVFFQDDAELARLVAVATRSPAVTASPPSLPSQAARSAAPSSSRAQAAHRSGRHGVASLRPAGPTTSCSGWRSICPIPGTARPTRGSP